MLERQPVAGPFHRARRLDRGQQPFGAASVDFPGNPAGNELRQQGVEPTRGPVAGPAQIMVAFRLQTQHPEYSSRPTRARRGARSAATATDNASLVSFLFERPVPNTRTRAARLPARPTPARPPRRVDGRGDSRARRRTRSPTSGPPTAAHATTRSTCRRVAGTAPADSGVSSPSIATACATPCAGRHRSSRRHATPPDRCSWKAGAGTPDFKRSNCRTSFEPRPSEIPAGQHLARKPRHQPTAGS